MVNQGDGPSGRELLGLLRASFPEIDSEGFAEDLKLFDADSTDATRCGVLTAFSSQFNNWVREERSEPVRRAPALIDRLLAEATPVPEGTPPVAVGDQFHNSLLSCFVEDILDTTPEFKALVIPNLGPVVREHLQLHDPFWLQ